MARLDLAKQMLTAASIFLEPTTVEAAKRESREHDPLVNELGEILGAKLAQHISGLLDKNFPGNKMAGMRQSIRTDTVNAFRKSLKRNFNAEYDRLVAPQLMHEVEQHEAAEEKAAEEPKVE